MKGCFIRISILINNNLIVHAIRFLGVGLITESRIEKWRHKRANLNQFFHKR